ncbi:MAG: hypothetical protein AUG89_13045 [Acidobacteria bacterium 13_1_20CM_4_56_7]|nr:MAG: hypothetical protein AUG89_13045 [Acidobacteria bacterium 13_1_20CM_4_56_7]
MTNELEGAGGDHAEARRVHHLYIPVLAHGEHYPETHGIGGQKYREHDPREKGEKRPVKKDHLEGGANQNQSVDENNPAKFGLVR